MVSAHYKTHSLCHAESSKSQLGVAIDVSLCEVPDAFGLRQIWLTEITPTAINSFPLGQRSRADVSEPRLLEEAPLMGLECQAIEYCRVSTLAVEDDLRRPLLANNDGHAPAGGVKLQGVKDIVPDNFTSGSEERALGRRS